VCQTRRVRAKSKEFPADCGSNTRDHGSPFGTASLSPRRRSCRSGSRRDRFCKDRCWRVRDYFRWDCGRSGGNRDAIGRIAPLPRDTGRCGSGPCLSPAGRAPFARTRVADGRTRASFFCTGSLSIGTAVRSGQHGILSGKPQFECGRFRTVCSNGDSQKIYLTET
jgi:hypothetical protein